MDLNALLKEMEAWVMDNSSIFSFDGFLWEQFNLEPTVFKGKLMSHPNTFRKLRNVSHFVKVSFQLTCANKNPKICNLFKCI